jgi:hypothetical protein
MVCTRKPNGDILLNNQIYIENMLMNFDGDSSVTKEIPALGDSALSKEDCVSKEDYVVKVQERYQSLIGSLLYAAICWRPDIMYRVSQLARFNGVAGPIHVKAANYLLRYLRNTSDWGLKFKGGRSNRKIQPIFITSCDASYAANEDRVSVSGWTRQMVDMEDWKNRIVVEENEDILPYFNCTSYSSHRQKGIVATSSTEAEYIAGADTVKMVEHSDQKFVALGFPSVEGSNIYVDNTSMMKIAEEWKVNDRTRHIDIRFHHIRISVIKKRIFLMKVDGKFNTSDMMTKSLHGPLHERHRSKLMVGKPMELENHLGRIRVSRFLPKRDGVFKRFKST